MIFPAQGIDHVFPAFQKLRAELVADYPERFKDFPEVRFPTTDELRANAIEGKDGIRGAQLVILLSQVEQARVLVSGGETVDRVDARTGTRLGHEKERVAIARAIYVLAVSILVVGISLFVRLGCGAKVWP